PFLHRHPPRSPLFPYTTLFRSSFTYKASDGQAFSNVATVSITVTPVNDPPVAANDAYGTNEDTTLTVAAPGVLANDTDIDSTTLDRKSTRLNSSHRTISYAVFC